MKRADGAAFAHVDVRSAVVGVVVNGAEGTASEATIDGIKVDGESALEVVLAEVEVETNGIAIAAIDVCGLVIHLTWRLRTVILTSVPSDFIIHSPKLGNKSYKLTVK